MKFATAVLAFAGLASAEKIPVHRRELSYDDLMVQKEFYQMRAMANSEVPVKDHFNT